MKQVYSIYFYLIILTLSIISCSKEVGLGGNSSITGKVTLKHYNQNFSLLKSKGPAIDEYVYVIFDGEKGYGTRVKTAYDGSFQLTNLTKGKYIIYCYSMDTLATNVNGIVEVIKNVEIIKNKSIKDIGEIEVADNKAIGYATISGKIKEINTQNNNQYYIGEQRVYIVFDENINYQTSIKTNYNGEYQFTNLPIGNYELYTYSVDVNNNYPSSSYEVKKTVNIAAIDDNITLQDLIIYK